MWPTLWFWPPCCEILATVLTSTHAPPALFLTQTRTCQKTTNKSYRLKTSPTSSRYTFHWQQNQNFSTHLIYAVNRFEVIKTTFQSGFHQLCVKCCLVHLERLLWTELFLTKYDSTNGKWRWSLAHHMAKV